MKYDICNTVVLQIISKGWYILFYKYRYDSAVPKLLMKTRLLLNVMKSDDDKSVVT